MAGWAIFHNSTLEIGGCSGNLTTEAIGLRVDLGGPGADSRGVMLFIDAVSYFINRLSIVTDT